MASMFPTAGELRHLAQLEAPSRTSDEGGGAAISWSPVAEVWCAIRPRGGDEIAVHDRLASSVRHEVWMRWRADATAGMRLVLGDRVLAIRAAMDPDGRRQFLRLLAEETI